MLSEISRAKPTALLCAEGALSKPILYLSLHFKSRRQEYYDHLQRVRTHGDWEGWLRFFLEGVINTSDEAMFTTRRILALFEKHAARSRSSAAQRHLPSEATTP